MISNSVLSNNGVGLQGGSSTAWLAKSVVSGNGTGVDINGGRVDSYGDNYINSNGNDLNGSLSGAGTR
jgi:hypothetical protein